MIVYNILSSLDTTSSFSNPEIEQNIVGSQPKLVDMNGVINYSM